jgi:hypothetical protein
MLRGDGVEEGKKSIALSDGVLELTFAHVSLYSGQQWQALALLLLKSRYHGLAGWQAKWGS